MEGHNLKSGDLVRQLPHVVHSLVPKCDDAVVRENYRRTGIVRPEQAHKDFFRLVKEEPKGKLHGLNDLNEL